mmetsp:Transcript_9322/g.26211  ORF Transcript_9322/g.26211 Transcript_9322/m.26211 type:complete len:386 (-) Transcript_9322:295-1452(-)
MPDGELLPGLLRLQAALLQALLQALLLRSQSQAQRAPADLATLAALRTAGRPCWRLLCRSLDQLTRLLELPCHLRQAPLGQEAVATPASRRCPTAGRRSGGGARNGRHGRTSAPPCRGAAPTAARARWPAGNRRGSHRRCGRTGALKRPLQAHMQPLHRGQALQQLLLSGTPGLWGGTRRCRSSNGWGSNAGFCFGLKIALPTSEPGNPVVVCLGPLEARLALVQVLPQLGGLAASDPQLPGAPSRLCNLLREALGTQRHLAELLGTDDVLGLHCLAPALNLPFIVEEVGLQLQDRGLAALELPLQLRELASLPEVAAVLQLGEAPKLVQQAVRFSEGRRPTWGSELQRGPELAVLHLLCQGAPANTTSGFGRDHWRRQLLRLNR